MKFLVAGWFSFEQMGASAGDLLARDLVCRWIEKAGHRADVAVAEPFSDGIAWQESRPADYQAVIFVCGPFGNGPPLLEFFDHFTGVPLVGMNLTLLQSLDEWDPFTFLLERDSNRAARPDLVFLTHEPRVPVAGLILVHPQEEYGERGLHLQADTALRRLLADREIAVVPIDTRLDDNSTGLKTPAEVESLVAKMDLVVTTRLHGMVLSLKNGVPPLVVDPVAGGAKIRRQAEAIDWQVVFNADDIDTARLEDALNFCLSTEGREAAARVAAGAVTRLGEVEARFIAGLQRLER